MVDTLYANVNVEAELQAALPPRLQPLAGPAAGGIRQLTDKLANEALQRPRVQQLWVDANEDAQKTLLNVVENGGSQPLTLDVGTIVDQLGNEAGVDVAGKVPSNIANIQIASNDDLVKVNDYLNILKTLAWVLTLLALVLFALAIYLAEGWRRECLRSIGWAFIVVGALVLIFRTVTGNVVLNQLVSNDAVKPAAHNAWTIGTDLLAASGTGLIFYGVFMLMGAWLAGPGAWARGARKAITPILENRWVAYTALAVLLLILFAWSPTPAFSRLPTSLLLIALSIVGLEFLRAQAVKDFPEE